VPRFHEENQRMEEYFVRESKETMISLFMEVYIEGNLNLLIENEETGLKSFYTFDKFEDLKNLFFLVSFSKPSFELFDSHTSQYITQNLNKIIEPSKDRTNFIKVIDELSDFKDKIFKIMERSLKLFQQNSNFFEKSIEKTIKDCFVNFVNNNMKISSFLNKYLDFFMQKDHKKLSETENESKIEKIFEIFKLLTNKDLFEIQYRNLLTKRLLIFKNFNEELELSFLKRATMSCGTAYTSKFYSFFHDIKISSQNFKDFQAKFQSNPDLAKVTIEVVSQGIWSLEENNENFEFPDDVSNLINSFEIFYKGKHPERKMKWITGLGVGVVKANFKEKPKDLIMNNLQMFVLLCFNNIRRACSCREIMMKLRINNASMVKQVLLSFIRLKILVKNTNIASSELREEDFISVNEHFTHKNFEIKVRFKGNDEDGELNDQKHMEVLSMERKTIIEAYVIRILKVRKNICHGDLVKEVISLCSNRNFLPSGTQIKDSIESLINRDYIKRNEDPGRYSYIA